ncbi:TrlF family AAA-like ATPase [Shewanella baltica]|uniref:TrlF family AAA-like ATPase n=1 Tax=Shewanella baltica TaxID=62322 RepID=UPI000D1B4CD2|nr:PHP domain-containing protein [Shewanella baltica]AVT46241.1 hypothetical protein C8I07_00120 [Shewanella baltica]MCS6231697.1 PHP domain-containing protein [Shewanella baltica]
MTEENYNKYEKGSEWRRWDLHLHTSSSFDAYKGDDANKELVKSLKDHQISAVAITDHFLIDSKRINALRDLAPDITFFPGVELRTDKGAANVHVILIFSEKADLNKLEERFNVLMLGHKAKASDDNRSIYWDFSDIVEFAKSNEGLISVHAGRKSNGIDKEITNALPHNIAIKQDYADNVDIFEVGQVADVEDYTKYVFPQIGVKPLVICSDNHVPKDYRVKEYLWVKADPTFEGLKQVIYEPEERIRIQSNKPDEKPDYQVIESISLNKTGLWDDTIKLNENLNTIIGGRATGKSSLLASIAEKLGKLETDSSDYKEYIRSNTASITLNWKDGQQKDDRDIDYFPQSHMFELAREDGKRNKLIKDIVSKKDKQNLFSQYEDLISTKRADLAGLLSAIFLAQEDLDKLTQNITELGDRQSIEAEKKKLEDLINKANSGLTEQEKQIYETTCSEIAKNTHNLKMCDNYTEELTKLKSCEVFTPFDIASFVSQEKFKSELTDEFRKLKEEFEKGWEIAIDDKLSRVRDKKLEIQSLNNKHIEKEIYKKGQKQLEDNQSVIGFKKRLETEITKLDDFDKQNSELIKKQGDLSSKIDAICRIHQKFKDEAKQLSTSLKFQESDLQVTMMSTFDKVRVENIMSEQLLQRSHEQKLVITNFSNKYATQTTETVKAFLHQALKGGLQCKGSHTPQSVATQVLGYNTYTQSYELTYQGDDFHQMSQGKQAFVILKLLLEFSEKTCPILIDQPEDSLDNRAIYNELVIYLKNKKRERQILLVTHNSNVVVSADAEQVIVANQNGITLPNNNNIKFQYVTGSIEHSKIKDFSQKVVLLSQGIREHICEILEGGDKAFKKREQKYQLSKK